jgi:hypothetical protein
MQTFTLTYQGFFLDSADVKKQCWRRPCRCWILPLVFNLKIHFSTLRLVTRSKSREITQAPMQFTKKPLHLMRATWLLLSEWSIAEWGRISLMMLNNN